MYTHIHSSIKTIIKSRSADMIKTVKLPTPSFELLFLKVSGITLEPRFYKKPLSAKDINQRHQTAL